MAAAAAQPYEQVMEDMRKGQELATRLQGLLADSPDAGRLVDQILHAMSRTIETARAAAAAEEGSEGQSEVTCAGTGGGKRKAAGGGGDKRSACRRRAQNSSSITVNQKDIEDGHAWRKYGQKEIQNSKHPKAYFRCTHKFDQQCLAQRQVQRCDDDPETFRVTYIGVHTCRDPAAVAPVVFHHAAAEQLHAGSRLISFAPNNASAAAATASTTTTTTTGNTSSGQQGGDHHKDAALLAGLRPFKLEAGGAGEQEEVLSSLTPAGSSAAAEAARNAAATPGAPDQGDVTSGLQHCYGGGFADMMPPFGNYDDTFDLVDLDVFGFEGQPDY